jgi:hypothetical protein
MKTSDKSRFCFSSLIIDELKVLTEQGDHSNLSIFEIFRII